MTTKAQLLKVIRVQCISCMGEQAFLVEGCTSPECSLFPYRSGHDPKPSRKGNKDAFKMFRSSRPVGEKIQRESTISKEG